MLLVFFMSLDIIVIISAIISIINYRRTDVPVFRVKYLLETKVRFNLSKSIPAYGNGKSLAGWAVIRTRYFHVFVTCLPARKVLFGETRFLTFPARLFFLLRHPFFFFFFFFSFFSSRDIESCRGW